MARIINKDGKKCQRRMSKSFSKSEGGRLSHIYTVDWRYNASRTVRCWSFCRMNLSTTITVLLSALITFCFMSSEGGILKRHNNNDDEAVQTLLAVGLIAKALSDTESKDKKCPPQVTKVIHVPMHHHTERVYVVKEKDEQAWASDNKHIWKKASNVDWKH